MALSWKEVRRREFAKVPKGSPFSEYQKALKRAAAIYRGVKQPALGSNPAHSARNNPSGNDLLTLGLLGVGLYLGWQWLQRQQPQTNLPAAYKP